mmetsp:Transcript_2671/g.5719  ORF Transcript_2671/g.5719 Transcript_2671/m.5719 type:complete len:210 (+) Transcript_2671:719-1348(+)
MLSMSMGLPPVTLRSKVPTQLKMSGEVSVDQRVHDNEVAILVAYNGETCNLKWLWKLTNTPNSSIAMPPKCKFFINPFKIIKHYKSCFLHPSKMKLELSNLQSIYKYVTEQDLVGAHDSIGDYKAQTTIVVTDLFFSFIDKTKSIFPINEIFSKCEQSEMQKRLEPAKPVHEPWVELDGNDDSSIWDLNLNDSYLGPQGRPKCGPSNTL